MLTGLASSVLLASTLLTPPALAETADAGTPGVETADVITIPLVREEWGVWYTRSITKSCPDTHPYVHTEEWVGSLPQHVTFLASLGYHRGQAATVIGGPITNWNFETRYLSIDLVCTSDRGKAAVVPTTAP